MSCTSDKCQQGRTACPTRHICGLHQHNSDGTDPGLPVVMFESPWQWLEDVLYSVIFIGGTVVIGMLIAFFVVLATGLHRVLL